MFVAEAFSVMYVYIYMRALTHASYALTYTHSLGELNSRSNKLVWF